jgi:hypothetical protein
LNGRRGLTLAEILFSAGILTTVLVLLVGVFTGGLQLMQRSEVHTAASSIGREVLETIQDEGGFATIPPGDVSFNGVNPDPKVGDFPPDPYPVASRDGRDYSIRVEVKEVSDQMSAVMVSVSWDGGRVQLEKVFHAADSAL